MAHGKPFTTVLIGGRSRELLNLFSTGYWLLLYLDAHGLVDCSASALDGRSRDGYGTKIHMATDGSGIPLTIVLSPGQAYESQFALRLLDGIGVQREDGSMKYRGRGGTG